MERKSQSPSRNASANNSNSVSPLQSRRSYMLMSTSSMDMMMGREEGEQRLRVCMMGDSNVGKSSLVSQFLTSDHIKDFDATLGMNFVMNNN